MVSAKRDIRVLVTGGGTFLGDYIAAMLLAEGVQVSLLLRQDAGDRLGTLAQRTRILYADVWDSASLRGQARGHQHVVHTVGSVIDDPAKGLTHHRLNFISARNVANMCVSDGVPHLVLMSSANAPWLNRRYLRSKREAEMYLTRVGLQSTIIRAPLTYVRGTPRHPFYQLVSGVGVLPPLSWLGMRRVAPMPIDVLARGVARAILNPAPRKRMYYAHDLRRLNTRQELRQQVFYTEPMHTTAAAASKPHPIAFLDDEAPFGWTPNKD